MASTTDRPPGCAVAAAPTPRRGRRRWIERRTVASFGRGASSQSCGRGWYQCRSSTGNTAECTRRGWRVGHRWGGAAGGGDSGSSLGGSSGIGALGGAINTVLSSEPGVGTELPPVPPPPVVRPAMQQMSVMPLDAAAAVVDVDNDARTASFRAGDAAAHALAVEGGGVGAIATTAVTVDVLLATPPTNPMCLEVGSRAAGGLLVLALWVHVRKIWTACLPHQLIQM